MKGILQLMTGKMYEKRHQMTTGWNIKCEKGRTSWEKRIKKSIKLQFKIVYSICISSVPMPHILYLHCLPNVFFFQFRTHTHTLTFMMTTLSTKLINIENYFPFKRMSYWICTCSIYHWLYRLFHLLFSRRAFITLLMLCFDLKRTEQIVNKRKKKKQKENKWQNIK